MSSFLHFCLQWILFSLTPHHVVLLFLRDIDEWENEEATAPSAPTKFSNTSASSTGDHKENKLVPYKTPRKVDKVTRELAKLGVTFDSPAKKEDGDGSIMHNTRSSARKSARKAGRQAD